MEKQQDKHLKFRALHDREGAFVIPNPWDAGSARILAAVGFEALATTSAGLAFSIGRRDSAAALARDVILQNARDIVEATELPVSADLEDGFGKDPCAAPKRFRWRQASGSSVARSKTQPVMPPIRFSSSAWPWNVLPPPRRKPASTPLS